MDMSDGTFGPAILGGGMIGLALGLLWAFTGRVLSASGMIGSLLGGREGLAASSIAFIGGIFIAPSVLVAAGGITQIPMEASWPLLVIGGLMIGVAARLGSSLMGAIHGVIQLSRGAFVTFVAIMAGTVAGTILRQVLGSEGAA